MSIESTQDPGVSVLPNSCSGQMRDLRQTVICARGKLKYPWTGLATRREDAKKAGRSVVGNLAGLQAFLSLTTTITASNFEHGGERNVIQFMLLVSKRHVIT
jgi:hypothetical protein